jgi:serine protease
MLRVSLAAAFTGLGVQCARVNRRSEQQTIAGVEVRNYRPGANDWIVKFADGTSESQIRNMCGQDCKIIGNPSAGGVAWASVQGTAQLETMLRSRRSAAPVQYLVPDVVDYMIPIIQVAKPSYAKASWGLDAIDVGSRDVIGSGVNIYVQDTGVRTTHVEFYGRGVPALDVTSSSPVECVDGATTCAVDRQGHGTHCAGTTSGNTYGVAPGAKLYAIKTLSDSGSGARSWQYTGIEYVINKAKKPAVLSMSLGGKGKDDDYDTIMESAVNAGVVVVVAAGNDNSDACDFSPAFAAKAITVGATERGDKRAYYSNYGTCVNIMAPGSDIKSAWYNSDTASKSISGTSMACPHVSGAAALLFERFPSGTATEIREKLLEEAEKDRIPDIMPNDPNFFLMVRGSGSAPEPTPAPPTPPPPPTPAPACRRRYWC